MYIYLPSFSNATMLVSMESSQYDLSHSSTFYTSLSSYSCALLRTNSLTHSLSHSLSLRSPIDILWITFCSKTLLLWFQTTCGTDRLLQKRGNIAAHTYANANVKRVRKVVAKVEETVSDLEVNLTCICDVSFFSFEFVLHNF